MFLRVQEEGRVFGEGKRSYSSSFLRVLVEGRAFGEGKRSYIYVSPIYLFKCLASFLSVSAAYDADFRASELCAFRFLLFSFAKLSLVIWIRVVCVSVLVFFLFAIFEILIDLIDARCVSYSKFESSSFRRLQKTSTSMHLCSSVARWMISSAGLRQQTCV